MICKKCGTDNTEESQFCSKCGKKLAEKKEMSHKKKKIIICVIIIFLLVVVGIGIFIYIDSQNKKIYKSAIDSFIQLDFKKAYSQFEEIENYENAKQMKETCILQAEQTAISCVEANNYEEAIELCYFVGEHKDMSETIIKLKEQYIEYLLDKNKDEEAYNYLPNFPEISSELLNKTQRLYIISLIGHEQHEKGFELMNSFNNLTEEDKTNIISAYIVSSATKQAYNLLYNSMRNPSSLNVRNSDFKLYCNEDGEEYKSGYDKETGKFKVKVFFSYSGQNGFGGMSSDNITYVYSGRINLETLKLSLRYEFYLPYWSAL